MCSKPYYQIDIKTNAYSLKTIYIDGDGEDDIDPESHLRDAPYCRLNRQFKSSLYATVPLCLVEQKDNDIYRALPEYFEIPIAKSTIYKNNCNDFDQKLYQCKSSSNCDVGSIFDINLKNCVKNDCYPIYC